MMVWWLLNLSLMNNNMCAVLAAEQLTRLLLLGVCSRCGPMPGWVLSPIFFVIFIDRILMNSEKERISSLVGWSSEHYRSQVDFMKSQLSPQIVGKRISTCGYDSQRTDHLLSEGSDATGFPREVFLAPPAWNTPWVRPRKRWKDCISAWPGNASVFPSQSLNFGGLLFAGPEKQMEMDGWLLILFWFLSLLWLLIGYSNWHIGQLPKLSNII